MEWVGVLWREESAEIMKKICAIYTRKSSEEGLEQDFNSLDAQREACEAYIKSQKSEGWVAASELYNDGGFTGGNLERPALRKLMDDIRAGKIQTVVVYKIDRLTRSLMDFAKLVEVFDAHGVTFVSITQSFNTTTSMGRLMLNVLLSFAQFEREVTGERIRDKIAASKKKGMWMGGVPPLGYNIEGRSLLPDPDQARTVRMIFDRYLALGCVRLLKQELDATGVVSPLRLSRKNITHGGHKFSRGKLYDLLKNPVYIGKIKHKDQLFEGQHDGIIDEAVWHKVQALMNGNAVFRQETAAQHHILRGLIFDPNGVPYSPTFTKKSGKRYRYYISQNLLQNRTHPNGLVARLAAHEIEAMVSDALGQQIKTWLVNDIHTASYVLNLIKDNNEAWIRHAILKMVVGRQDIKIIFQPQNFANHIHKNHNITLCLPETDEVVVPYQTRIVRNGAKMIEPEGRTHDPLDLPPDQLKRFTQGIIWRERHFAGETLKDIARADRYSDSYIRHTIMKSFDTLMAL